MVAVPILSAESLCRVGGFFDGALRWCFGWLFNWCFGWCFCLHLSWLLAWCFGWFPGWWLLGWFLGWCFCLHLCRCDNVNLAFQSESAAAA
jgi:hypothetical protein